MNISAEGVFDWVKEQSKWILFIALIVLLIVTGFKRAWVAMIGGIVGFAFISIFVFQPEFIKDLGTWISEMVGIS